MFSSREEFLLFISTIWKGFSFNLFSPQKATKFLFAHFSFKEKTTLPNFDCSSILPSPLIIRSAFEILLSISTSLKIVSIPLSSFAFKKKIAPAPKPPAAPAPSTFSKLLPYFLQVKLKAFKLSSKIFKSSFVAPFCFAYT